MQFSHRTLLALPFLLLVVACNPFKGAERADTPTKVEMHLSAFGVESDNFPTIDCLIDFVADTCSCSRSYYNPMHKPSTYKLMSGDIKDLRELLKNAELDELPTHYTVTKTDQPTSTATIYTTRNQYVFEDYGLSAPSPLFDLYKIVYRF